jgi:hypothetical protein
MSAEDHDRIPDDLPRECAGAEAVPELQQCSVDALQRVTVRACRGGEFDDRRAEPVGRTAFGCVSLHQSFFTQRKEDGVTGRPMCAQPTRELRERELAGRPGRDELEDAPGALDRGRRLNTHGTVATVSEIGD